MTLWISAVVVVFVFWQLVASSARERKMAEDLIRQLQHQLEVAHVELATEREVAHEARARVALMLLRDEMNLQFPDVPDEQSLLSPPRINHFLLCRPRTRQEWFDTFPVSDRMQISSPQIREFLPRVLNLL